MAITILTLLACTMANGLFIKPKVELSDQQVESSLESDQEQMMEHLDVMGEKMDKSLENYGWELPKKGHLSGGYNWDRVATKKNERVQKLKGRTAIIFYGDSIVEQLSGEHKGDSRPELKMHTKLWKENFDDRYGQSHASGIGADRIGHLLYRLQNGGSPKKTNPKVIMLEVGTCDIHPDVMKNNNVTEKDVIRATSVAYRKLVEELRYASPDSTIVMNALLPRGIDWGSDKPVYQKIIPQLNQKIAGLATQDKKVRYVDCGHTLLKDGKQDMELVKPDHVHPTFKGFKVWTECIQKTLDDILPLAK